MFHSLVFSDETRTCVGFPRAQLKCLQIVEVFETLESGSKSTDCKQADLDKECSWLAEEFARSVGSGRLGGRCVF